MVVEVKEANEGPVPGRPWEGVGLPPGGTGEQGKDRPRFVQ